MHGNILALSFALLTPEQPPAAAAPAPIFEMFEQRLTALEQRLAAVEAKAGVAAPATLPMPKPGIALPLQSNYVSGFSSGESCGAGGCSSGGGSGRVFGGGRFVNRVRARWR